MPRRARITVIGVPHHVVQRGHNREATVFADEDYLAYLHSLRKEWGSVPMSSAQPAKRMGLRPHVAAGAERFKDQIETVLARSVRPGQAGRKKTVVGLGSEQESLNFERSEK